MSYDTKRFQGDVVEELICSICSGVLEDPLQAPSCEHAFCKVCINEWLSRQSTCPVDNQKLTNLGPGPRITRNFLSRLNISCDHVSNGCTAVLRLDDLPRHLEECEHDPKKPLPCDFGCGLLIPKDEIKDHILNKLPKMKLMKHSRYQGLA